MGTSYEVLAGDEESAVVLHVPHSSRVIPPWVRERIVLDDEGLSRELDAMTDAWTDRIAAAAVAAARAEGRPAPWRFVNRCSRLVVDPERFTDPGKEPMAEIGMGPVYTATHELGALREPDADHEAELMATYFVPYAEGLADLVDARLAAHGRALVIDVHSYPREVLPYERHPAAARPPVCLGADDVHTPESLREAAEEAFAIWDTLWDQPFAGTYVPTRHHQLDDRVASVMVEIRRDSCTRTDGSPDPEAVEALGSAIARLATWRP